jgi:hypothetical protein
MKTLGDLFDVRLGNKLDLNKMQRLLAEEGGVNFVGRSSERHGVSATIAPLPSTEPFKKGLITVALGGAKLLSAFVQEDPFYTAQNVAVLTPREPLSFAEKVFVCMCVRANRWRYSAFGREANRTIRTIPIPPFPGQPYRPLQKSCREGWQHSFKVICWSDFPGSRRTCWATVGFRAKPPQPPPMYPPSLPEMTGSTG